MIWVLVVSVAVVLIAVFLAMLAGRLPYDGLSEPVHSTPPVELAAEAGPDDVAALRFDTALRGYRMDQVDTALNILQKRIAALEEHVASQAGPPSATAHASTAHASTTASVPTQPQPPPPPQTQPQTQTSAPPPAAEARYTAQHRVEGG